MTLQSLVQAVAFVAVALILLAITGPLTAIAAATLGLTRVEAWTYAALYSALLIGASVAALRFHGSTFCTLGLAFTRQRGRQLLTGFVLGATLFVTLALVQGVRVGAEWTFGGAGAVPTSLVGLTVALLMLLPEELLFRGYALQRLDQAVGAGPAAALSAGSLWTAQLSGAQQQSLFSPDFGPHVPYILTMIVAALALRAILGRDVSAA